MLQNLIVREKNEAFARAGQRDANRKLLVALDEARLEGTRVKNKQDEGGRQNFPYLKLSTSPYQAVFGNTLSYSLFGDEESVVRKLSGRDGVERIAAALDDWSASENDADRKIWLASVARRIDPDPFRNRLRAALVSRDRAALLSMVKAPEVGSLPAVSVGLLAKAIDVVDHEAAIALLTRMRRQYPKDFWIHLDLGNQLLNSGPTRSSEAVRFLTAAVALNPESPGALIHLARALGQGKEHVEEVISLCLEALRLKPDYAEAHHELGNALQAKGRLIDAVGEYHAALKLKPDYAEANKSLGDALKTQGENDESHYYLGNALRIQRRLDDAIEEYRAALQLNPDNAEAHCILGLVLQRQGLFVAALDHLRRGHELGANRPDWPNPSAKWVSDCEVSVKLEMRLQGLLQGDEKPMDNSERLRMARFCLDSKRFATSARFFDEALSNDPNLGDDRLAQHRYNAACAAAMAGCGQGRDDPGHDEAARVALRAKARAWLIEEMGAWSKIVDSGKLEQRAAIAKTSQPLQSTGDPKKDLALSKKALDDFIEMIPKVNASLDWRLIAKTLAHWKDDADLTVVRDPDALAKFPEDERKAWLSLWENIEQLLKKVSKEVHKP